MENTQQVEKINSSNRLKKTLSMCILGLFLFLILILVYEYFRIVPENVRFTNVTSTSVTVSWNTKNPISATAVYKKGDGGFINLFGIGKQVFYDTRDLVKAELKAVEQTSKNIAKSNDISVSMSEVKTEVKVTNKGKYYTHHVEIKGLDPETEYSFFVGDDLLYRAVKDVDGNTVIKTSKVSESVKTPVPAYGSIYDSMNTELSFDQLAPINDGIVYFNYVDRITGKKSNLFSGVLNEEGNWYIDVAGAVDDEGKPFMDTYDTVEGNVYVELNINAGNLGIWRKTENAYVLTPASNTVINMPNAVVDPTIEGSVVRADENIQTSVKGTSDNILAKLTGEEEPTTPCACPSGYSAYCPSGKTCTSITQRGSNCKERTCYKVNTTPAPTPTPTPTPTKPTIEACSYFLTFDCKSPCYFINDSGNYEQCGVGPDHCNMGRLKELGLDCDDDANNVPQENNTCAGGAVLGQCTYVKGEGCKQCKWVQNKWGGYRAIWSVVGNELCGSLSSQSVRDCEGLPNCTNGKLDLNTNTCICNTGYNWDNTFKRCVQVNTNTCYYPRQSCYINGKQGYCTGSHECKLNGEKCSKDGKEGQYSNGECIYKPEEDIGECTEPGCKCNTKDGSDWVYNLAGDCVEVGAACSVQPISTTIPTGKWSEDGYCKVDNTSEVPISNISPGQYCWTVNVTDIYSYQNVNGKMVMYKCEDHELKEIDNYEADINAVSCRTFSKEGENKCDSPTVIDYIIHPNKDDSYCIFNGAIYFCSNNVWKKVEDIGKEEDIIVGAMTIIKPGEECTGKDMSIKCQCSDSKNIIGIGEWCVEVNSCSGDKPSENNGKICDLTGKKCDEGKCSDSNIESGVPLLYANYKLPCNFPKCKCVEGVDDGKLVNKGQFCRQVSGCNLVAINEQLNKICNNEGNTCKYDDDSTCSGNKNITYVNDAKGIEAGKKCTYTDAEKDDGIFRITTGCKCISGIDKGSSVGWNKYCRDIKDKDCKTFYDNCMKNLGATDTSCKNDTMMQVCNGNGNTCTYGSWECTGNPPPGSLRPVNTVNDKNTLSIINLNNFKVSAQSKNINSQYVIDQKTGMFVNLPQGEYIFEYEGQQYYFEITDPYGNKRVFIDKGLDGKYDEGTDILVSDLASIVQIEPIELKYTYVLKQGFNFVSFPFLVSNQEYRTAASLLKKLNDIYEDSIYSIAKYDGSWKVVGQNEELYSANDFQLLPGQGYVIKAKDDVTIDIWGKPIKYDKDSPNAPIALFKGWNLVGLYGSGIKQYTAKTLIEDINKYEKVDFSADNVSKWDNELQRYEGFQISDKNGVPTEYGFDYLINLLNSYFVRVQDGEGNWQPELAQ